MSMRLLALSLTTVTIVALTGCAAPAHNPDEKYYLVTTNKKVPYWQNSLAGLTKVATDMKGIRTEMVGPDTYNPQAQHDEFQSLLGKKPAGILVSVSDPKLIQPDIDSAIERGIPVITMDADAEASKRLLFIGTDNYKAGTMGGEMLVKQLNGKGNVIVFSMPEQANLIQRMHGYTDVLASHPGIKIVQTVDIQGTATIAFDTAKAIVRKNPKAMDAFVCLEAIACPEIADVLDREKISGKTIIAMDTDDRTLQWIQKGMITATIGQKPFTMAYYGVKMLDDLYHHKPGSLTKDWKQDSFSTLPTFVDTGVTLIDKANVDSYSKDRESATTGK